ncbi:MAG: 23S rRNA (adenine(2503)-C(2))-methyltransferase RlmN [Candidatus Dormibacteraeota bacterium]|nr:23S rRNA (adenine(2503)-C(2))-methyltransferase RlmN [Candidatus Dormibacteraeota bacterium]
MHPAPALSTLDDAGLRTLCGRLGIPEYRAAQLRAAPWQPFVATLDDVRQLPTELRSTFDAQVRFSTATVAAERTADAGATIKLLCGLDDSLTVETVAMETPARGASRRRGTACVSSQVGCAVGCPFCATGRMGLRRSCTAAEIVDQVRLAGHALHRHGFGPVTHVVYMGMGEPLANAAATIESLHVLTGAAGISARRITVSTSGVVPGITRLQREAPPVTLAISLHAATDELRNRLVPLNRAHPIAALLSAAGSYASATGRRISVEWCLIGGVNDSLQQAQALRELARSCGAHVNVIPMNRIEGSSWGPPDPEVARQFLHQLRGVQVTVRDTRGGDVDAACGQLRASLEARRELRPDGTLSPPRTAVGA